MKQYHFWWDEMNIEHIANHGVEPYEAEEVIDDNPWILKAGQESVGSIWSGRQRPLLARSFFPQI